MTSFLNTFGYQTFGFQQFAGSFPNWAADQTVRTDPICVCGSVEREELYPSVENDIINGEVSAEQVIGEV